MGEVGDDGRKGQNFGNSFTFENAFILIKSFKFVYPGDKRKREEGHSRNRKLQEQSCGVSKWGSHLIGWRESDGLLIGWKEDEILLIGWE